MKNVLAYCLQHHPKVKGFYIFGKILPATWWYGSGALLTPYLRPARQTEIKTLRRTLRLYTKARVHFVPYYITYFGLLKIVLTLLIPNITLNVFTP